MGDDVNHYMGPSGKLYLDIVAIMKCIKILQDAPIPLVRRCVRINGVTYTGDSDGST